MPELGFSFNALHTVGKKVRFNVKISVLFVIDNPFFSLERYLISTAFVLGSSLQLEKKIVESCKIKIDKILLCIGIFIVIILRALK